MNKYAEEMEKVALNRLAKYFQSAYAEGRAVSPGILDRIAASSKGRAAPYAGIPRGASRPEMGVTAEQRRGYQREMEASKPMWRSQDARQQSVREHMASLDVQGEAEGRRASAAALASTRANPYNPDHRGFFKSMDDRMNGIRGMMNVQSTAKMYP